MKLSLTTSLELHLLGKYIVGPMPDRFSRNKHLLEVVLGSRGVGKPVLFTTTFRVVLFTSRFSATYSLVHG